MKTKSPPLPPELQAFIDSGNTTFHCDDGEWDVRIALREDSPFRDELPPRSTMIAENGCGDCLFLKTSAAGKPDSKVHVFWHEEERHEVFAKHVKELTEAIAPAPKPLAAEPSDSKPAMSVSELETALNSPDLSVREDAMRQFEQTDFGSEALPVLRKALADDWVDVVIRAAACIGKIGPEAATCPAGQELEAYDSADLQQQLMQAGNKIHTYSGYRNAYSACLEALQQIEADDDRIVEFVGELIGLSCPDDLICSLNALKSVGTPEALSILQRAAIFWYPELNKKYTKEVEKIVAEAKASPKKRK